MPKVDVEQAQRAEGHDRIQPGAGRRDQQLILADLDGHARARDRVAGDVKQRHGPFRNADLDRLGDGRDDGVRRRQREGEIDQRETRSSASPRRRTASRRRDQRAVHREGFDLENAGDARDDEDRNQRRQQASLRQQIARADDRLGLP